MPQLGRGCPTFPFRPVQALSENFLGGLQSIRQGILIRRPANVTSQTDSTGRTSVKQSAITFGTLLATPLGSVEKVYGFSVPQDSMSD